MAIRGKKIKGFKRHPGSVWIDKNREKLMKKYPDECIAADGRGLVLHDKTYGGLFKKIQSSNIKPEKFCITFMQTDSL